MIKFRLKVKKGLDQAGSDPALHGSDPIEAAIEVVIEAKANRAGGGAPTGLET